MVARSDASAPTCGPLPAAPTARGTDGRVAEFLASTATLADDSGSDPTMALELHQDFTFNPDGSGRVTLTWTGPAAGAPPTDEFVRGELERANGVDAWDDVRCEIADDRLVFTATAWFADSRALRFHCQGLHVSLLDFEVTTDDDGSVQVTTCAPPATTTAPPTPTPVPAARLREEREKIGMARDLVAAMFGELVCTAVLRLPAALVEPVRGERIDDGAVAVRYEGCRLVEIIDRLMSDDALLQQLLATGGMDSPAAALALLGDQGPVSLRTVPGAGPAFDYAAEVAAARERFAAVAAEFGAAATTAEPDAWLDQVRIVAAKVVREADAERELCPQGQNHRGVTLTVAGDLPAPALEIESAGYDRCVLADGNDVTPGEEWDRRCHFPKTTNDGRTVLVDLELPAGDARGVAELTGHVLAIASAGSEAHDLGFAELAPGAEGTFAQARLQSVDSDDDRTRVEVQVQLARARVLALDLVVGDTATRLEQVGYSCCNDESSLTYRVDGALPADARLVMTVASELARTRYGFRLTRCDWFGDKL